jgi:hypothetical protein
MAIDLKKMMTKAETLRCPRCNGEYLHHYEVASYFRKAEDSGTMVVTKAGAGGTHVGNGGSMGNPSARRDGVVIHFDCETCNASMYLEIAQHKGQTLINWMLGSERS